MLETLETRQMLAADYLYSLTARPGAPDDGFGWSHAASDDYHVVGNPFLERQPVNGFVGEVQIHDADSGALLRTIANPDPEDLYRFGYSVDVFEDWIVVGAVGWADQFVTADTTVPGFSDRSGRAYLFEASTGNLLFTLDGTFTTGNPGSENHDQFGESVSIDGNYVVVGAPGISPFGDGTLTAPDGDAGHAYIFDAATGALLHVLANPEPEAANPGSGQFDLDFGITVSTSNGKVVVANPDTETYGESDGTEYYGKSYIYDAMSGALLHTLLAPDVPDMGEAQVGQTVAIDGNVVVISGSTPGDQFGFVFDTTTGSLTQTLNLEDNLLSDLNADSVATRVFVNGAPTSLGTIIEVVSGDIISDIAPPAGYAPGSPPYLSKVTIFGNRLLVGEGNLFAGGSAEVLVYSIGTNTPPTDINLSNASIDEHSANGTVVGGLTAVDPTPGDSFTFALLSSAGGRFAINGSNLVVGDGSLLDFNTQTSHMIEVQVTDSVGNTFNEHFTITVLDVNTPPTDITLNPNSVPESTIKSIYNPVATPGVSFGYDVAISGDLFAVGMNALPASGIPGSVSVFHRVTGALVSTLVSPSAQIGQLFGEKIAFSGTRVAVSARLTTGGGAVHVFDATTGILQYSLNSPLPGGSNFGDEVELVGDLLVVRGLVNGSGRIFIYDPVTGTLLQTIQSPQASGGTTFGNAVAMSDDRLLISEPQAVLPGNVIGPVVHFYGIDAGSNAATHLTTIATPGGSTFGTSLALQGVRGIIGSLWDDSEAADAGRVYIVDSSTGTLERVIQNPSPDASDYFGSRVAASGNLLVVGANQDDAIATNSGVAYVFDLTTGELLSTLTNPSPNVNDYFGGAIAIQGTTVLVGAPGDDTRGGNAGVLFQYSLPNGQVVGSLAATDADVGDTTTWTLLNNSGGRFALNGNDIVVRDGSLLNFESSPLHSITVRATDSVGQTFDKSIFVVVTNLAESQHYVFGTETDDAFVVTYSGTLLSGTATVTRSTDGGPLLNLGVFPMNAELILNGLSGIDTVRVEGSAAGDVFTVTPSSTTVNGSQLRLVSIEQRTLAGGAGPDTYRFDADGPLGLYRLDESSGGSDGLWFDSTTTVGLSVNLSLPGVQVVHPTNLSLQLQSATAFEQLIGGSGNDVLTGNSLANIIVGGHGSDSMYGGFGDDTFSFYPATNPEVDYIAEYSNQGTDTISFANVTADVSLSLTTIAVQTVHTNRTLQLSSAVTIENLIGGDGDDLLRGNPLDNQLTGGPGNDRLIGGIGNDSLIGGFGDDEYRFHETLTGETDQLFEYSNQGTDALNFATLTTPVFASLATVASQSVHLNRSLTLNSTVTFENLTGGMGNDTLTGNALDNELVGNEGNDTFHPAAGSDSVLGGSGDDSYYFVNAATSESDSLTEWFNQGTDIVSFGSITSPVSASLNSITSQNVHVNRTLLLNSTVTFEHLSGGFGHDVLLGNTLDNYLFGSDGNDQLNGLGGNDVLFGGNGDDTYVFHDTAAPEEDHIFESPNSSVDTLNFTNVTTNVAVDLSLDTLQPVHLNRNLLIVAGTIVERIFSGSGNDTLIGNAANNDLRGGAGNDVLIGGPGDDQLTGSLGDDEYIFHPATSAENDQVFEYASPGSDVLTFATLTTPVNVGLNVTSVQPVHTNRTLKLNSAVTFERITGGLSNDYLVGNALNNVIHGLTGNDLIAGLEGNDVVYGGEGDDSYAFTDASSLEQDAIGDFAGGGGRDSIGFLSVTSDVTIDLSLDTVQTVHLNRQLVILPTSEIEGAFGGLGNNALTGNALDNFLVGAGDADVLIGMDGNDILSAWGGNDQLFGGNGRDLLIGGAGQDSLDGGADEDVLVAGTTANDPFFTNLNDLRTAWLPLTPYATRVTNLRAGVGATNASLNATITALNDASPGDSLTGASGQDWFLAALDDVITDLFAGELVDAL